MSARHYSPHQQKIIKAYYDNRETIMLQKLQELITEAYLAETPKKRNTLWDRIRKALANLEMPQNRIDQVCDKQDPAVLAEVVQNMLAAEDD